MVSDRPDHQGPGASASLTSSLPSNRPRHRRVPPLRKPPNTHWRSREYLTPAEVETLIRTARHLGRHGHRDATMIQLAYRHGLRVAELMTLR
jgi:integrase